MAQGIGLSSLSDLIKGMAFKVVGKIRAIGGWLASGPHIGLEDLEEEAASVANMLDAADQILEDTSQMVDEALASQCDEEGLADQIENRLIDAAAIITEETVRSVLEAVTGGALTFQATALTFDKNCLAQGEETCADTGEPDYIAGMGGMNFCVSCGSCENPSERGPECPMTVQFADVTAYCGPGLGLVIQNIRGTPRYNIPWLPQWTGGVDLSTGHICEPGTIVPF